MSNGTVIRVIGCGNLGADPEIRQAQDGREYASFSFATSESWTDKASGERKEKVDWHKVSVTNPGIVQVVKKYLKKGSKVLLIGGLQNRSWDKNGEKRTSTEIVISGYEHSLTLMDKPQKQESAKSYAAATGAGYQDDEIPY
jgi:single-strand DNA-binding protein